MATSTASITLEEFRRRYAEEKPGYEFWFGEAVSKAVPTRLHNLLEMILVELLTLAGYSACQELTLRIDPSWEPIPDVVADLEPLPDTYPTRPVELVAEILSPEDRMERVFEKYDHFHQPGIKQVLVFNYNTRVALKWNPESQSFDRVYRIVLSSGAAIETDVIWAEFERRRAT